MVLVLKSASFCTLECVCADVPSVLVLRKVLENWKQWDYMGWTLAISEFFFLKLIEYISYKVIVYIREDNVVLENSMPHAHYMAK